ncbi:hypothetical protein [Arthrobacter sp. BF1]|nr:hypothetical protein [Arthrobacter sp. BF1]
MVVAVKATERVLEPGSSEPLNEAKAVTGRGVDQAERVAAW